MKALILILFVAAFIMCSSTAHAQKEFWAGVNPSITTTPPFYPNAAYPNGAIVKTDSAGNVLSYVHIFDTLNGRFCNAQLLQATNGKLYGTTSAGGSASAGTLFEYDPVIDNYRVLVNFGTPSFPYGNPTGGLIETSPGILYGIGSYGASVYTYDIAAETIQMAVVLPSFPYGLGSYQTNLRGQLFKASDGYIYGTTGEYSACPSSAPSIGAVVKINPATNVFSYAYPFNCTYADGVQPNGGFVELGGKLYSNTTTGGIYGTYGQGVIFSYDLAAHTYTKKMDFSDTTGIQPVASFIKASNNKFYGYIPLGFDTASTYSYTMYEYDPGTNMYSRKHGFNYATAIGLAPFYKPLQASNGKLYGATGIGVFEYDITADTIRHGATLNDCIWQQFIEICRKPAYTYYSALHDTVCQGLAFSFNLHCTNAQTAVWSHNGIIDPTQTASILSLTAVSLADSGTWACTLTNQCGTTLPPPIHLSVSGLPSAGGISGGDALCIGSSITLADTVSGGIWSIAPAAIATISTAGVVTGIAAGGVSITYTVANSCGSAFDTALLTVSPAIGSAGTIAGLSQVCTGATISLTNTTAGGVWSISAPAIATINSSGVLAGLSAGAVTVTYTISNSCGSVYDTMAVAVYSATVSAGTITGMPSVCVGDTIMLGSSIAGGTWSVANASAAVLGGVVTGVAAGIDTVRYTITTFCGSATATSLITVNAPPLAGSVAGQDSLCVGDTARLVGTVPGGAWGSSNTAVATVSPAGLVTAVANGNVIISYSVANSCGTATAIHPVYVRLAVDCATDIATVETSMGLKLFPNPSIGIFNLLFRSTTNEPVQVVIRDITGRKIHNMSLQPNTLTALTLNQPAGIYQLIANTTTEQYEVKLVITK